MSGVVNYPGCYVFQLFSKENAMALVKLNDRNDSVRQLQYALNETLSLNLPIDGLFAADTQQAVIHFQKAHNLAADGIAGPATFGALGLTLQTKKVNDADFARAAATLKVTPAHVRSVTEVEARGSGFAADGRPIILYERHQFYKYLAIPRKPTDSLTELVGVRALLVQTHPEICNPQRGGYTKSNDTEWARLNLARSYSDTAGLMSASYGLFQIMGFNYKACGFEDVQSFVRAMSASEGDQLDAFVSFVKGDKNLLSAIQSKNWASFAEHYNGPAYAENKYDTKLAAAFAKWGGK
jgi:peptidoglycan hydrolase-like protein with peptidoglycan-binding domain